MRFFLTKLNPNPPLVRPTLLLACSLSILAQSRAPVFRANSNLQSIAVQVTDKQGSHVQGLSASDFTLLEDGRPEKIAFFEAESHPISLAVLIDSSRSMDFGGKLERARALLALLIPGNRQGDEIFLMPFTDELGAFQQLSFEQRSRPPVLASLGHRGSAVYDALASAICHMRTARNVRQAVVVITNGVDEHVYHEDFSDSRSGWPNRHDAEINSHYISGGYQLSRWLWPTTVLLPSADGEIAAAADTVIAAYGPWWDNFRASASVDTQGGNAQRLHGSDSAGGIVFHLMEQGYCAMLLNAGRPGKQIAFEFVKGS